MPRVEHLDEAMSIAAGQPSDDRLVIIQDLLEGRVVSFSARFRQGRWIGENLGEDLTDGLTREAIWMESRLFPASAMATR